MDIFFWGKLAFYQLTTLTCPLFVSSHCITGSGFPGQFGGDGDDDDSLSPEACYECKINGGGGKKGRHRRNADENDLNQVHM